MQDLELKLKKKQVIQFVAFKARVGKKVGLLMFLKILNGYKVLDTGVFFICQNVNGEGIAI